MKKYFDSKRSHVWRFLIGVCTCTALFLHFFSGFVFAGELPDHITADDGSEMVIVPGGAFEMGSSGDKYPEDEQPRHKVMLDTFYMDKYEITNEMFARFLNETGPGEGKGKKRESLVVIRNDLAAVEKASWYPAEIRYENGRYGAVRGFERYPVLSVSWYAASEYCKWAGKRLPTEAEWEKAARGGLDGSDFPWGDNMPTFNSGVVFGRVWTDNTEPAPVKDVGNYPANGYGLFDMAGNVSEWCSDWYGADYYRDSPRKNPAGPESGARKINRGGSWASLAVGTRVAARMSDLPDVMSNRTGFRCVKTP